MGNNAETKRQAAGPHGELYREGGALSRLTPIPHLIALRRCRGKKNETVRSFLRRYLYWNSKPNTDDSRASLKLISVREWLELA
ncbi:hypothetical protein EVAR_80518_1 [Eumeta japonica]|uniref:Uncharacterized protein n=1 Tax=Eumeta variegata TaxID=151549 RepID=A0A4C1TND0_EUMVA|nr:hypothetical protein EVAR_80518_1 [Eumeta japonica]